MYTPCGRSSNCIPCVFSVPPVSDECREAFVVAGICLAVKHQFFDFVDTFEDRFNAGIIIFLESLNQAQCLVCEECTVCLHWIPPFLHSHTDTPSHPVRAAPTRGDVNTEPTQKINAQKAFATKSNWMVLFIRPSHSDNRLDFVLFNVIVAM